MSQLVLQIRPVQQPQPASAAVARSRAARASSVFGTGTLSGPDAAQAGSLLELSQGGKKPIHLANGETRTFLEDGDCIVLRGYCERSGARRIGFGECRGTVLPARSHR